LVQQHKYPVTQAAETMNIGLSTLQRWLRQFRGEVRGDIPTATAITSEQRCHGNEQRQKVAVKLKEAGENIQQVCRCLSLTRSVFYVRSRRLGLRADILMLHAAVKHVHC
jgi:transposase-like protein